MPSTVLEGVSHFASHNASCVLEIIHSSKKEFVVRFLFAMPYNWPSSVQHLYFMVAAPALFLPLGIVLIGSRILPRIFGYLALLLGAAFGALGVTFLLTLTLPGPVTAFAGVQAFWWLGAALTLMVRSGRIPKSLGTNEVAVSQPVWP